MLRNMEERDEITSCRTKYKCKKTLKVLLNPCHTLITYSQYHNNCVSNQHGETSLCLYTEPQCLYCEWLYCACRRAKVEQLVGERE